MANAVHPDKINMTNILTPLHIGRQRDKPNRRPHDPARRRRPKWRRTTPKADDNANAQEGEDVENVSPGSGVGESGADETRTELGEGDEGGQREGDGGEGGDDHDHDHDHATDHDDFTCQPTSSQHSAYIRANLEMLQKKCSEFQACTQEVYRAENFHRILAGGNIQLSNMCGLMYANGGGRYTSLDKQCTKTERNAIRQDIGSRLKSRLVDPPQDETKPAWKRLNRCLQHNLQKDEQYIDTVCRLKKNSDFLCQDHGADSVTEKFFNHEMEHLHCSCKAIKAEAANAAASSPALPVPVRLAIAGGVCGLLLLLLIVVVVLCVRHRRMKRELKKHRMQYLPSPHGEPSAIYQEIGDHSQAMEALRRARDQGSLPATYQFMDQAPALPDRYVKDISRSRTNLADPSSPGDVEYLEPIPDPNKSRQLEAHSNDAYNASQGSQRSGENNVYDLAKHPVATPPTQRKQPESETYFDRINLRRTGNNPEEDGGYSSLSRKHAAKAEQADRGNRSAEETEPLTRPEGGAEEPKYFVLETNPSEKEALAGPGSKTPV